MRSILPLSLLVAAFATAPATADPGIAVDYRDELLRVTLDGSWGGTYYQVWRAGDPAGPFAPIESQFTLCTGDCSLTDASVVPGRTYWYRFDLLPPDGPVVSYGPYAVTVPDTPLRARVSPNPSRSAVRVELSLPGSRSGDAPLVADARVLDLQGRTVRVLHSGPLGRGVTALAWDGRGEGGRPLNAGLYFVRLSTPIGFATSRVVRVR